MAFVVYARRSGAQALFHDPGPLPRWEITLQEFFLYLFAIICAVLVVLGAAGVVVGALKLSTNARTVLSAAAFSTTMMASALMVPRGLAREPFQWSKVRADVKSGTLTLLICLPFVMAVTIGWIFVLQRAGFPVEKQDIVQLFLDNKSSGLVYVLIALAVIVAPIGEELVFRGILFRFLRMRLPRWAAYLIPAVLFSASHQSVAAFLPLVTLALIFAYAYERTGRIGTVIVAHGLFNLLSVVLALAGLSG